MWPPRLRVGPFRRGAFTSRLRSPRLTSQLGLLLAVAFGVCFLTGLLSHLIQHPPSWFWWPSRPVWLYRVTQGLHVATGLAAVPLLAAKLWSVFPKLFAWPPFRDPVHALERLSVLVLASSALFQLVTGVLNIARWYDPMPFGFIAAHYWTAWLAIGSLLVHIAVKLPIVRRALGATPRPTHGDGLSRRGLLAAVGATAAAVTVATVGQTVRPLRDLSVLAPRRPDTGPQGLPVNTSAAAARIVVPVDFRFLLVGPRARHALSLADLAALPQHTVSLPITCVEGWSADARWTGVRVADLLALLGEPGATVLVESLQADSPYRSSTLAPPHARDPLTLLALRLNGEVLHPDHGYPCRLIAPNRPGVLQTKWVSSMTVVSP
ncbi:molybdopterin-dependent oxidoreductase [Longispora sp. NPDC051575]|uniref:molybdopterin-dependent oxidoreductase n=1 Tax=Longispora sp. NPDC051575 TaxID=3154943 RepID=UPI00341E1E10